MRFFAPGSRSRVALSRSGADRYRARRGRGCSRPAPAVAAGPRRALADPELWRALSRLARARGPEAPRVTVAREAVMGTEAARVSGRASSADSRSARAMHRAAAPPPVARHSEAGSAAPAQALARTWLMSSVLERTSASRPRTTARSYWLCSLLWRIGASSSGSKRPSRASHAASRRSLALAARDQRDLAGVGDDDLVAEVRHDAAQPRRARPRLEHDPRRGEAGQRCAQPAAVVRTASRRRGRGCVCSGRPRRGRW